MKPILEDLLVNLFKGFEIRGSEENEYIMKGRYYTNPGVGSDLLLSSFYVFISLTTLSSFFSNHENFLDDAGRYVSIYDATTYSIDFKACCC